MTTSKTVEKAPRQDQADATFCAEVDASTLVDVAQIEAEILMQEVRLLTGAQGQTRASLATRDLSPLGG